MSEVKLLTEAELEAAFNGVGLPQVKRVLLADLFRERGLIAPEPDPLEQVFGEAFADSDIGKIGGWHQFYVRFRKAYDAAGMELAQPSLTREMVEAGLMRIGYSWPPLAIDRLHAALTERQP